MPLKRRIDLSETRVETERLLIRPTGLADLDPIFNEFTDRVTTYMFPRPARSIDETAKFIADSIEGQLNGTNYQVTMVLRDDPKCFVGCSGIHHPDSRTPELGLWVAERHQGKGFGTEAISALCRWAAQEIDCDYLQYQVDQANIASRKIPEGLGGDVEDEYDLITPDGRTLNILEYRIYQELLDL
jgi:ribosomal-protein-alanine N-acetyltransferase